MTDENYGLMLPITTLSLFLTTFDPRGNHFLLLCEDIVDQMYCDDCAIPPELRITCKELKEAFDLPKLRSAVKKLFGLEFKRVGYSENIGHDIRVCKYHQTVQFVTGHNSSREADFERLDNATCILRSKLLKIVTSCPSIAFDNVSLAMIRFVHQGATKLVLSEAEIQLDLDSSQEIAKSNA